MGLTEIQTNTVTILRMNIKADDYIYHYTNLFNKVANLDTSFLTEQQRRRPACTYAHSDQRLCHSLFRKYHIYTCNRWNFNFLASLCIWGDYLKSLFVGNPVDRFVAKLKNDKWYLNEGWSILQYLWPALSDILVLKTNFWSFWEWLFKTGFTVLENCICILTSQL